VRVAAAVHLDAEDIVGLEEFYAIEEATVEGR